MAWVIPIRMKLIRKTKRHLIYQAEASFYDGWITIPKSRVPKNQHYKEIMVEVYGGELKEE